MHKNQYLHILTTMLLASAAVPAPTPYEMCTKLENYFCNLSVFFKLPTVLGTIVENAKLKKVAPGIYPSVDIRVLKLCFHKIYFFGALIEWSGPVLVSS